MKSITFIFINFMVGFISDIILNDLSKVNKDIMLEDYFKNKYIFEAAVYAGLTIAPLPFPVSLIRVAFGEDAMIK